MELFIDLGLKEIASIIGRMGLTTDINELHGEVELNGIKYNYEKHGNEFKVTDSLGHQTNIKINYSEEETKDDYNRTIRYLRHDVSMDYLLKNGDYINLSNNIGLDSGYESFENVHRHDIISGVRTKYCDKDGKEVASFGLGLDRICLKDKNKLYEFNEDGIKCGNRIITLDGNTLVSISGSEIPNLDVINSFNLEKEQDKLRKIAEESDLHPFTKEILDDSIRKLDRKERFVKDIVDYYNTDIKDVRNAIEIRNRIINGIESSLISKEGMELVEEDFYKQTMNRVKRKRYF